MILKSVGLIGLLLLVWPLPVVADDRLAVSNDPCLISVCPGNPPPATSVSSGASFNLYVAAFLQVGGHDSGPDTAYRGTVIFSSTDPLASLPVAHIFGATDGGEKAFSGVILRTAGRQTITGRDVVNGLSGSVTLNVTIQADAPAVRLAVTNDFCLVGICPATHPPAPTSVARGQAFTIYVTGFDSFNSRVSTLTSAVHFSTTDPSATLPSDFVFVPEDQAVRTFVNGAVLRTSGVQTITVSDPSNVLAPGSLTLTVTGVTEVPTISVPTMVILATALALVGLCFARLR